MRPGEGTGIAAKFEMMLNGVAMGVARNHYFTRSCVPHNVSLANFSLCLRKFTAAAAKDRMKSRKNRNVGT